MTDTATKLCAGGGQTVLSEFLDAAGTIPCGSCGQRVGVDPTGDGDLCLKDHDPTPAPARTLGERCYDVSLRVERIVHLDTMLHVDVADEDVVEWLAGDAALALAGALGWTENDFRTAVNEFGWTDGALQTILGDQGVRGWLIEAAHPETKRSAGGYSVSWSSYCVKVFYAATYAAAVEAALAWADDDLEAMHAVVDSGQLQPSGTIPQHEQGEARG